jgi:DNA-binding transcriptional MerR regulator
MTVRNVRAHAARGLLPPPHIQGRTGFYGTEHLARLELITHLQSEGFSLAAIERLVDATPSQTAERALSQYLDMLMPWQAEPPVDMARDEFTSWVGVEPAHYEMLAAAGLIEDLGGGAIRVHSPGMVRAGAEAVRLGMPLDALLSTRRMVLEHVTEVAENFVDLFRRTVWQDFVAAGLPADRFEEIRDVVAKLQPVAAQTVMSAFRETMPRAVGDLVREASRVLGDGEHP